MDEYKVHCDLGDLSLDGLPDPMGDELIELALNKMFSDDEWMEENN